MTDKQLKGAVSLPGSKSESNRALMVAAYGGFPLEAENLSSAHDTFLMQTLLEKVKNVDRAEIDCEDAGTVSRFLMTYLACRKGIWILTAKARMRQRPMAPLIEALRGLGAEVECLGEEGFLPVRIKGRQLEGGSVVMDASLSSQFASSLLMAAPTWEKGLRLRLKNAVSMPYIDLTLSVMRSFGAAVERVDDECLAIHHGSYCPCRFEVSPDWSAASYWYEMAALSERCDLLLKGASPASQQGDAKVTELFKTFGVASCPEALGVRIGKIASERPRSPVAINLADTPDLFPAVFVTCVALHVPARIQGIQTLSYKESDRIQSLIAELSKLYHLECDINDHEIKLDSSLLMVDIPDKLAFCAHDDHRVVMALAPIARLYSLAPFDHPEVVTKSYPGFWDEVERLF